MHVDVARFASDDFNPFHDRHRWQTVSGNPFGGVIALGFQLSTFVDECVQRVRAEEGLAAERARFSRVKMTFVDALRTDDTATVEVKSTVLATQRQTYSNRVVARTTRGLAAKGVYTSALRPTLLNEIASPSLAAVQALPDCSFLDAGRFFLKRRYLTTANAKNFLLGANIDPNRHIDEIASRAMFPPLFPAAMLSAALLERARQRGHDFLAEPMVYSKHAIEIDLDALACVRSDARVCFLISNPRESITRDVRSWVFPCAALSAAGTRLLAAELTLILLGGTKRTHNCVQAMSSRDSPEPTV